MGRDDQVKDFLNYSFDSDDKYKTWLAGVEYTSNSAETLLRLKAKYYKKNIVSPDALGTVRPAPVHARTYSPAPFWVFCSRARPASDCVLTRRTSTLTCPG